MKEDKDLYKNWFVVQVKTNREYFIKDFVESNLEESVKMLIFTRELLFERKKHLFKIISPMFPGYLFIHQKIQLIINTVHDCLPREYIRPICFKQKKCKTCFTDTSPCMVFQTEMEYLLDNADTNGMFRLSTGTKFNEKVVIINGPLKRRYGDIIWINEKKKKACVEIELFRRKMKINVGINLLKELAAV